MPKRLDKGEGPPKVNRSVHPLRKLSTGKRAHAPSATQPKTSRQKLEKDLEEGYLANAASARAVAEGMMGAEVDLA
jgi:hypothetical protein